MEAEETCYATFTPLFQLLKVLTSQADNVLPRKTTFSWDLGRVAKHFTSRTVLYTAAGDGAQTRKEGTSRTPLTEFCAHCAHFYVGAKCYNDCAYVLPFTISRKGMFALEVLLTKYSANITAATLYNAVLALRGDLHRIQDGELRRMLSLSFISRGEQCISRIWGIVLREV